MPYAENQGAKIYWEEHGSGEPMLLIMGLGAQMIHWEDDFCRQLAGRGFRVIRFDNRDIGQSSSLHGGNLSSTRFASPPVIVEI